MATVIIYTKSGCPYCTSAIELLQQKQVKYDELAFNYDEAMRDEMIARTGGRTFPQIIIDDQPIGGCDDLYALENSGKLDELLGKSSG